MELIDPGVLFEREHQTFASGYIERTNVDNGQERHEEIIIRVREVARHEAWLQDGIDRDYFAADDCREALRLGLAAGKTISALQSHLRKRAKNPSARQTGAQRNTSRPPEGEH